MPLPIRWLFQSSLGPGRAGGRRSRSSSRSSSGNGRSRSASPSAVQGATDPAPPLGASQLGRVFAGYTINSAHPRRARGGDQEYVFDWGTSAILAADVLGYDAGYRLNTEKQGDGRWLRWLLASGPDAVDKRYLSEDTMTEWRRSVKSGWRQASQDLRGLYPAIQMR